jgi:hypothetical protein
MYMQLNRLITGTLKFILLWVVLTIVMIISWPIAMGISNKITNSSPPETGDPASVVLALVGVCVINAFLLSLLFWRTKVFGGRLKWIVLLSYPFVIQFLLTQMETFFFSTSMSVNLSQVTSILLAGALMSLATCLTGLALSGYFMRRENKRMIKIIVSSRKKLWPPVCVLVFIVYPLLYLSFGYFIAWQNEELRFYYTRSTELRSFFDQTFDALTNGIYLFQVLRGFIWIAITAPVALMLKDNKPVQYILTGILSALLPATLLFIPNPYMPANVAWVHFVETSLSNFVWGIFIVYALNKTDAFKLGYLQGDSLLKSKESLSKM